MSNKQCNCGICPLVGNCFCGDHAKCGLNEYVGRHEYLEENAERFKTLINIYDNQDAVKCDSKEVQDTIELVKALEWANEVHLTDLNYKAILEGYRSSGGSKFPIKLKKDGVE